MKKTGIIFYDEDQLCFDIKFNDETYLGGIQDHQEFEIYADFRWVQVRLEKHHNKYSDGWQIVAAKPGTNIGIISMMGGISGVDARIEQEEEGEIEEQAVEDVLAAMLEKTSGQTQNIQALMKRYAYAHLLGVQEKLSIEEQKYLEVAAIFLGWFQENQKKEKSEAKILLKKTLEGFYFKTATIDQITLLLEKEAVTNPSQASQILRESAELVKLYETQAGPDECYAADRRYFKTATGKKVLQQQFGLVEGLTFI